MFSRWFRKPRIYLDCAAATPLGVAARRALRKAEEISYFGNPSSIHTEGREAKKLLEAVRGEIARLLEVHEDELVFTSGGTESDNLAILGVGRAYREKGLTHGVTSVIEHAAVLESFRALEKEGGVVSRLSPNEHGYVSEAAVQSVLTPETLLVSIGLVNSELGSIAPIRKISNILKKYKASLGRSDKEAPFLHTDASQAATLLSVRPHDLGVDLMTLDAAKLYGPKGIGLLFVQRGLMLTSQVIGGGQERGRRAGTESVSLVAAFGAALAEAVMLRDGETKRMEQLNQYARKQIAANLPLVLFNTVPEAALPSYINICIPGVDAEFLSVELDAQGVAVSSASACRSISGEGSSYVLKAIPGKAACASSSLRITFGRDTTMREIDICIETIAALVAAKK